MSRQTSLLVTACGSSIGLEVAKSLRKRNGCERIIGTEVSWWGKELGEKYCDEVFVIPRGDDPRYVETISSLMTGHNVALTYVNTDPEIESLAQYRSQLPGQLTCPTGEALAACVNKKRLHDDLSGSGLTAETIAITSRDDLQSAIERLGSPVWLRCATGPRGHGSIPIENAEDGWFWIEYWARRSNSKQSWLCHEYLPGRNLNWTAVWYEGELVTSCTGERLKYFLADVAVSGITGNVSHCQIVPGMAANEVAKQAVQTVFQKPHGVFAVDLREDKDGRPLVTEINARQAFRPLLYTTSGCNFSAIIAELFLHGKRPNLPKFDAGEAGWEMIRGMDFEPLFRKSTE